MMRQPNPAISAATIIEVRPKTWVIGSTPRIRSSRVMPRIRADVPPPKIRLPWLSITPFGLPVLLFAAFLLGFLPPFILYRANRWRMRRRVERIERAGGDDLPSALSATVDDPGALAFSSAAIRIISRGAVR